MELAINLLGIVLVVGIIAAMVKIVFNKLENEHTFIGSAAVEEYGFAYTTPEGVFVCGECNSRYPDYAAFPPVFECPACEAQLLTGNKEEDWDNIPF